MTQKPTSSGEWAKRSACPDMEELCINEGATSWAKARSHLNSSNAIERIATARKVMHAGSRSALIGER
jgi:hypothetical protein